MWVATGAGREAEPEELDMITQRFAGMFLFNREIPNHYSALDQGFTIAYRGTGNKYATSRKQGGRWEKGATHHTAGVLSGE